MITHLRLFYVGSSLIRLLSVEIPLWGCHQRCAPCVEPFRCRFRGAIWETEEIRTNDWVIFVGWEWEFITLNMGFNSVVLIKQLILEVTLKWSDSNKHLIALGWRHDGMRTSFRCFRIYGVFYFPIRIKRAGPPHFCFYAGAPLVGSRGERPSAVTTTNRPTPVSHAVAQFFFNNGHRIFHDVPRLFYPFFYAQR